MDSKMFRPSRLRVLALSISVLIGCGAILFGDSASFSVPLRIVSLSLGFGAILSLVQGLSQVIEVTDNSLTRRSAINSKVISLGTWTHVTVIDRGVPFGKINILLVRSNGKEWGVALWPFTSNDQLTLVAAVGDACRASSG
jgi:hypothetical protein